MSDIPFISQLGDVFELAIVDIDPQTHARRRWVHLLRLRVAALASAGILAACGAAVAAGVDPFAVIAGSSPTQLFRSNPAWWNQDNPPNPNTAIVASSVRDLGTIEIPHVGAFEYWGAQTKSGTYCEAFRGPDRLWAGTGANPEKDYNFGGPVPGCGITTTYPGTSGGSFSWTNNEIGPAAGSRQSNDISILVYGTENYPGATAVLNPSTGVSAPVFDGTYFALVLPPGSSESNVELQALSSSGAVIGHTAYNNHD